jgi:hypothetical protein
MLADKIDQTEMASRPITVRDLFAAAELEPCGPVAWGTPVGEKRCGIYVVAVVATPETACDAIVVDYLPQRDLDRWIQGQPAIYVGCTTRSLARRLAEFYRHRYGDDAPHAGGQAVKLLKCQLWVFWDATGDPIAAERAILDRFVKCVGRLPFANRRR